MFEALPTPNEDRILALALAFRDDPRSDKLDLGIGIYKDAQNRAPVMAAVKAAERALLREEASKSYLGLAGDEAFLEMLLALVLGSTIARERLRAVQTPGGAGAIRLLLDLAKATNPQATVWLPQPTWINHEPMVDAVDLRKAKYPYLSPATGLVDFDAMMASLAGAKPGDVVLLHGCCHNPTGADLTPAEWRTLGEAAARIGWTPFVDLAYLGLGDGIEADATGLRLVAGIVPEMMLAVSCSKSFALYRERTGCAAVICNHARAADLARANLMAGARATWSFPPSHGAAVVRDILGDPELTASWRSELGAMRDRLAGNRVALAAALRRLLNDDRFDVLTSHKGMFSLSGLGPRETDWLRRERAIFVPDDGRLNLAGLNDEVLPRAAQAIAEALSRAEGA